MIYIDTSVIAAYYCPEPLSQQAQKLLTESGPQPAISLLTEAELYSAVARKVRMYELSKSDGTRILAKFSAHMETGFFSIHQVDPGHWKTAKNWIGLLTTPLRTLDALHLSIVSAGSLELVTADKHLLEASKILGIPARFLRPDKK